MSLFNINPETKTQLLAERLQQLNLEGYQHELNKKTAEAIGNTEAVTQANDAIAIIQQAIAVTEAELNG
jgi:uncharacterized small protein (DUF1192 family)